MLYLLYKRKQKEEKMRSFEYGDSISEYEDEEVQVEISFFCDETVRDNEECSTEWTEEFTVTKGGEYKLASECPYCKATNEVTYE